jgi:two-component system, NarL family, sensor histidine kinase UhpB
MKQEAREGDFGPDFRLIVDAVPDACVVLDEEFNYLYVNPAAERISGHSAEELRGKPLPIMAAGDPDRRLGKYRDAMRTGEPLVLDDVSPGGVFGTRRFRLRAIKMGAGLGVVWTDITGEKKSEGRLRAAQAEIGSLAAHLLQVREDERKHIAREMHDELGQILTAIDMELRWINRKYSNVPAEMRGRIEGMLELSARAVDSVRRMSSELRPGVLDNLGLKAAIEWLAADYSRRTAIEATADMDLREETVGEKAAIALFRITQEAMTNVARHSRASKVRVSLEERGDAIILEVRDDGVGITRAQAEDPCAFGLMGIRERVRELGGEVSIRGDEGRGTVVSVSIPLPASGSLP